MSAVNALTANSSEASSQTVNQTFPGFHDPENSTEFSQDPEIPQDLPEAIILEAISRFLVRGSEQAALNALRSTLPQIEGNDGGRSAHDIIWRICDLFRQHDNGPLVAHCMMLLISREPMSEADIAQRLKITKAAVSAVKVRLQDALGIVPRCGRSMESRQKFAAITKARGKRRKEITWTGKNQWQSALASTKTQQHS